jgi:hypothetical protein
MTLKVSGCPSYVHSVHSPRTALDTPKPHNRAGTQSSMSSRPMGFAIVGTQDMFGGDRPHVYHTVETESHWTSGHAPGNPGAVKRIFVSSQNRAEWTLWTCIPEVIV